MHQRGVFLTKSHATIGSLKRARLFKKCSHLKSKLAAYFSFY
ncbi:hypothetical protein PH505_ao00180 [Pseudoalteromonas distincta]|nr:hypothetical protein PH505_ao00180 [Pseudoalteromonas distincta]